MSLLNQARKNIALKFTTEAVIRLLAMGFIVILARRLGDRDYGKYSLVFYFAGLLTTFCDLGL
ncbi:MAG TPA: oligosaccharide flippase family protein, partial [Thermodesulfobacteriota bacterium]|nr:oligosaccharide flippase family protein [Thermodesulfobacteriota bacterium]